MKKPHVVISLGDFNGIGYEIALKSLVQKSVQELAEYTLVGSFEALAAWKKMLGINIPMQFIDAAPGRSVRVTPGKITAAAGAVAARSIEIAAGMCMRGEADVLVTAPIAKESFHKAGVKFPGHTEMLQSLTHSPRVTMILLTERMRVALVTIHRAIKTVPGALNKKDILIKISDLHETLRIDFDSPKPRIAVLGLNPHASENGMFGDEEKKIISPAITSARAKKIAAEGPFPADGFFARWTPLKYDAILAMYHDQGLIPLKMDARGGGVNFSANLPIVRTSPDHGTAFDIAGKNRANESSFIEAIKVGLEIARNRKLHGK